MKKHLLAAPLLLAAAAVVAFGARAADPAVTIKLATVAPDGSPWAVALHEFKALAEKEAGGALKVKLFLGGVLGDENDTVLACKRGQIQAVGASTGALASQIPELNVLEMPYLFRSAEEADHILDNVIKKDIEKLASDRGLVFGFWSENGFRSFGGSFPVRSPADLKGKKMRSQESPVHLAAYRAFGASPVPIPTTEALTALQTKVVDGYDQTPLYAFAASWHTVSTHYSVSNHIYQPAAIVFHKPSYDTWPQPVKDAIQKASGAILAKLRSQVRAMTPILLDNLKASGVQVNVVDDAGKAEFQKLAETARADYLKGAGKGEKALATKIEAALKDLRAGKK